jgi:hypothetical protein
MCSGVSLEQRAELRPTLGLLSDVRWLPGWKVPRLTGTLLDLHAEPHWPLGGGAWILVSGHCD